VHTADRDVSTRQNSTEFDYVRGLDGIRALAVLAVLAFHAKLPFIQGGFLGVDVFFTLSGFLITALALREIDRTGGIKISAFYARRALRLLPALFATLAAVNVATALFGTTEDTEQTYAGTLAASFYVANWIRAFDVADLGPLEHCWSLAIEEQFYLIWPCVLAVTIARSRNRDQLLRGTLVAIMVSQFIKLLVIYSGAEHRRLYNGLDTHGDGLLVGCMLAILLVDERWKIAARRSVVRPISYVAITLVAVLVVLARRTNYSTFLVVTPIVGLATCAVIMLVLYHPDALLCRILENPILVAIGKVSYGLYLWHYPVYHFLSPDRLGTGPAPALCVRVVVTTILVVLSYHLIEKSALRLKHRYSPLLQRANAPIDPTSLMPEVAPARRR
jgi:peptidoglycan/LPS O-acetylase OafA/YrhL